MKITFPNASTQLADGNRTLTGPESVPYAVTAGFICFTESDFPFEINIPGVTSGWIKAQLGISQGCLPGEAFTEFQIRNPPTTPAGHVNAIEWQYGFGSVEDRRLNVVGTRPNQAVRFTEAPAGVFSVVDAITSPLAATSLSGGMSGAATTGAGARGRRKFAIFNNLDPTNGLWVMKGASYPADCLLYVPALDSRRLDTDGTVYVYNPNATPLAYLASHVYYTSPQS